MTSFALATQAVALVIAVLAETWLLVHLRRQTGELDRRSADLERRLRFRQRIAGRGREGQTQGALSLPAGSILNDFELRTLDDRQVTGSQWRGEPIAVVFVQHDCPFSLRLIETMLRRNTVPTRLLFATTGDAALNRSLFSGAPERLTVLLQEEVELARVWRVPRTPAMYLIDERGVTDGPLRVGAGPILKALDVPVQDDTNEAFDTGGSTRLAVRAPFSSRPLAVGQQVPDVQISLLDGGWTTLAAGPRTLLLLLDLRCSVCRSGLDTLSIRVRAVSRQTRILALSWGDENAARDVRAALGPDVPVSVQPDTQLLKRFGFVQAPSAVLLDERGYALAATAIGIDAVVSLLETLDPAGVEVRR